MASIQSPVSFTGATKPAASDLLNNGVCGVPLKSLAKSQLGAKMGDFTVLAKRIERVRKHDYPWPRDPDLNVEGAPFIHLSPFKPLKEKPKPFALEFEKPLLQLEKQLYDAQKLQEETGLDLSDKILELESKYQQRLKELFTNLTPIQRVHVARHPNRPTFLDHVFNITEKFIELHGDRAGYDDPAIVTGLGTINGRTYMFIGHQKGRNTKENIQRNFGMPTPNGYRKALRMMKYADHHGFPIVTCVDTPGAYCDLKSEETGQGEAIAQNLRSMFGLKVPIVSIIIGEGGSGGALAIACANKLLMLENSVFYVASPEAAAAILFKSADAAPKAAKILKITATELTKLRIADGVIPEPFGGAHADSYWTSQQLKAAIVESMDELLKMDTETLLKHRSQKFRNIGRAMGMDNDPRIKFNMKKKEAPTCEVELWDEVDKLIQQAMKAIDTSSPLPTKGLEKMIQTLNQAIDSDYVEAAKVLGLQEKALMVREEFASVRNLRHIPALNEKLEQVKREFLRNLQSTPNYPSLKAKRDMVINLKDTLYLLKLKEMKDSKKLKLKINMLMARVVRSSDVKDKIKLLHTEMAKAGDAPDEESNAKILALREEVKQAMLRVREKIEKLNTNMLMARIVRSLNVKDKIELLQKELEKAGDAPDEESNTEILALLAEVKQAMLEVGTEETEKLKAETEETTKPSVGSTEDDPYSFEQIFWRLTSAMYYGPPEDEKLPPLFLRFDRH